jgi:hypothetical protein
MAVYSTGSVRVKPGSAVVVGSGTAFTDNVIPAYLFKITGENIVYTINAVYSATRLALSGRYENTAEHTNVEETLATCTNATTIYSGFLSYTPVIQDSVKLTASYLFIDDGGGQLSATPYGSGSVDYDSGYYTLAFTATLSTDYSLTASYDAGNTLSGMNYQIVTDYTPNYGFPEAVPSDKNLAYIYTKAVRMIDLQLKELEDQIASWH